MDSKDALIALQMIFFGKRKHIQASCKLQRYITLHYHREQSHSERKAYFLYSDYSSKAYGMSLKSPYNGPVQI